MPQNSKPRVAGAIFQNTSGRGPEYTGTVEIDGVATKIALWAKVSAKGQPYLQISEDRKRPVTGAAPQGWKPQPVRPAAPNRPAPTKNPDMDDDIPF